MKKVSIVVPVFNLEKSIEVCVYTLINQTYSNLEIILIDDGSNDKSLEICQKMCKEDCRIFVLNHENKGVSYTRNRGISFASGDYIMFIDGDDKVLPDMIEKYVTAAEEYHADVVIGGIIFVDGGDSISEKNFSKIGIYGNDIWENICQDETGLYGYVPNKLYRADLIKTNNIFFNTNMYAQEDLDFALTVYSQSNCFCLIDYAGYIYYYVSDKRKHPLDHFICNKIKMLKIAESRYEISEASKIKIINQIKGFVFVTLYESTYIEMKTEVEKLHEIKDLDELLLQNCKHPGIVIKLFQKKAVILLNLYFFARKLLRHLRA